MRPEPAIRKAARHVQEYPRGFEEPNREMTQPAHSSRQRRGQSPARRGYKIPFLHESERCGQFLPSHQVQSRARFHRAGHACKTESLEMIATAKQETVEPIGKAGPFGNRHEQSPARREHASSFADRACGVGEM